MVKFTVPGIQSKITRHAKKHEINQVRKTNPELTHISELSNRNAQIVITVFYLFKKLCRDMEDITKT